MAKCPYSPEWHAIVAEGKCIIIKLIVKIK